MGRKQPNPPPPDGPASKPAPPPPPPPPMRPVYQPVIPPGAEVKVYILRRALKKFARSGMSATEGWDFAKEISEIIGYDWNSIVQTERLRR